MGTFYELCESQLREGIGEEILREQGMRKGEIYDVN
jgi:hypothetical protein